MSQKSTDTSKTTSWRVWVQNPWAQGAFAMGIALSLGAALGTMTRDPEPPASAGAEAAARGATAPGKAPVAAPASPPVASAASQPPAPRDWADTVSIPEWVVRPRTEGGPTRPYRRLSGGTAGERGAPLPPPPASAPRVGARQPVVGPDVGALSPILVQRVAGRRLEGYSLGLGQGLSAGIWAIPGECDATLRLRTASGAHAPGEQIGRLGEWIFSLAVPDGSCPGTASISVPRRLPSAAERAGLSRATHAGTVVQSLGTPPFDPVDLRDLVVFDRGGPLVAWGVFRKPLRSTQVYPAPPQPQLAFVARSEDGSQWEILWGKYTSSSAETVGLAGVHDPDHDRVLDAFFVVRAGPGASRVLRVGPQASGTWGVRQTLPLPDLAS